MEFDVQTVLLLISVLSFGLYKSEIFKQKVDISD